MTQTKTIEQMIQDGIAATLRALTLNNTSIARVREQMALSKEIGRYGYSTADWNKICDAMLAAAEEWHATQQPAPVKITAAAIEPLPLEVMVARASAKMTEKSAAPKAELKMSAAEAFGIFIRETAQDTQEGLTFEGHIADYWFEEAMNESISVREQNRAHMIATTLSCLADTSDE